MSERWGKWACPYEGCEAVVDDPDTIRVTCCGTDGHNVLLGPVEESGWRWAEKHQPSDAEIRAIAVVNQVLIKG